MDKATASSSSAMMASYSDSLLKALNPSRIACSILSPDGDFNCKPMPAPVYLDASTIFKIKEKEFDK